MVGILKNGIIHFNSIFNPICICLQEVDNSSFLNFFFNSNIASFCGVKRSLGSIYVPSKKHKDSKDKVKTDFTN